MLLADIAAGGGKQPFARHVAEEDKFYAGRSIPTDGQAGMLADIKARPSLRAVPLNRHGS